ncbi:MAG: ATP-grasp domain-containing protein [Rudaea sp.]
MILVWGLSREGPTAAVRVALDEASAPVYFLDQRRVLETGVELSVDQEIDACIRLGEERLDLSTVTAAYLRPYEMVRLPVIARAGASSAEWAHAHQAQDALWAWAELTQALVLNRPSAMASNNSKPYQSARIRAHGFKSPDTLITTDRRAAFEFWESHDEVIYKSISGIRSVVSRLSREHVDRFNDLAACPTQFQEYVRGKDFRVHVVGEEAFAAEIDTTADDYRYSERQGAAVEIRSCTLERDVIDRCIALAAGLNLPLAGVDLRRSREGEWYCFEVNPSPAFTYYQSQTGQRIDRAIARLLCASR